MSGSFEYGAENRWHDQYFARELELTGTTATTEALAVGKHHGSLCVVLAAAGDEVKADALSLSIMECYEADGTFTAKADGPVVTLAEGTFGAGDIMAKLVLPDCKDYVKMQLAGGLDGKVDVYLGYLAR
ncbi:MAG: hypothetical protein HDQ89_10405 [Desulfovibrio sp.]|nr:hypothetical protein [Desulfovibrio sp.]